jgi:hypothetical protein
MAEQPVENFARRLEPHQFDKRTFPQMRAHGRQQSDMLEVLRLAYQRVQNDQAVDAHGKNVLSFLGLLQQRFGQFTQAAKPR